MLLLDKECWGKVEESLKANKTLLETFHIPKMIISNSVTLCKITLPELELIEPFTSASRLF